MVIQSKYNHDQPKEPWVTHSALGHLTRANCLSLQLPAPESTDTWVLNNWAPPAHNTFWLGHYAPRKGYDALTTNTTKSFNLAPGLLQLSDGGHTITVGLRWAVSRISNLSHWTQGTRLDLLLWKFLSNDINVIYR